MATLHSDVNNCIKSSAKEFQLLSSVKFGADTIKIQKKKTLKNRLNNMAPNIDPLMNT